MKFNAMSLAGFFCFVMAIFFSTELQAQFLYEEATKDGKPLNYYEIKKKAEEYWSVHDRKVKGNGYKAYKRWEYSWENRVLEDGSFPAAGIVMDNYNAYLKEFEKSGYNNSALRTGVKWTSIGPSSAISGYLGSGRINSIAFHPTNPKIIYAGSAGGGFWMTVNGGVNWATTTDNIGRLGVSGIVVLPSNPNTIFIATGDGDAGDNKSVGVLESNDGGHTWHKTGLDWTAASDRLIRKLILDPFDENTMYVASSIGIYRTTDGAKTWKVVAAGNFYDIEVKPLANSVTVYAATSNEIHRSTNNGVTWAKVYTIQGSNRIELAVTPANGNVVYALSSKSSNNGLNGLFRSDDSGSNFTLQSKSPNVLGYDKSGENAGGQGWYDLILAADPNDENTIYTGGVNCWKSTDGGINWELKSFWYYIPEVINTHADKHVFAWRGDVLFEGNDGGLVYTADGGDTWTDISGDMTIGQIYRIGLSAKDDKILAGHQDNGTKLGDINGVWTDKYTGGDGMECFVHSENPEILFTTSQFGSLNKSVNSGNNFKGITPVSYDGAWVTPFLSDPNDANTIYAAYKEVYKSLDAGESWNAISEDLAGESLTIMRVAPTNSNYIYAGTSNRLYRTVDGGAGWAQVTLPGSGVSMLTVSPFDENTIYVVRQNYTAGQKVYKSTDGGTTWENISGLLPNIPANAILCTNLGKDALFVGMDVGVYFWSEQISDWVQFNDGLPNVRISEFEFDQENMMLYVATYGRGIWKTHVPVADAVCNFTSDVASFSDCDNFNGYTAGSSVSSLTQQRFILSNNDPEQDADIVQDAPSNLTNCLKIKQSSSISYNVGNSPVGRLISTPTRLEWRMYVPEGKNAVWQLETDSQVLPFKVTYDTAGTAHLISKDSLVKSFNFTQNQWMNVKLIFHPDENSIELWTGKEFIFKYTDFESGQIRALNFSGLKDSADFEYFVDDILYYETKASDCVTNGASKFVCVNGKAYKNSNYALCDGFTEKEWDNGLCCTLTGVNAVVTDTDCGKDNGSVTVTPQGGKGVTYLWNTGEKTSAIKNLSGGTYSVIVSSVEGCKVYDTLVVKESKGIVLQVDTLNKVDLIVEVLDGNPPYAFLWNTGDTTGTITPDTSGTYKLTVTDAEGCTAELEYLFIKVATKDVHQIPVVIYPNPASGIFNIKSDVVFNKLIVTDVSGRLLKQIEQPGNSIDLSEFRSGVYLLSLHSGSTVYFRKVIVMK